MRTTSCALAVLLCLAVSAHAINVPFKTCGTGIVDVDSITVTGDLSAGKTVALGATGVLSKEVSDGTFDLAFSLYGITVLQKTGDLCSSSVLKVPKCPATAGPIAASGHLTIPFIAPKATYSFKMSAKSNKGELLFCITSDVNINAASQDEVWGSLHAEAEVFLGTKALDHVRETANRKPSYTPPAFLRGGN